MSQLISLDELIENFEFLDDWEDRYRYLIDLGKNLDALPDSMKTDINRVRGCTSQVWLVHKLATDQGRSRLIFEADSDAFIVRGLVAILLATYSNKTPDDILKVDIESVFKRMGLERNLSLSRRNGFFSMVERIKHIAAQSQTN